MLHIWEHVESVGEVLMVTFPLNKMTASTSQILSSTSAEKARMVERVRLIGQTRFKATPTSIG